VAALTRVSLRIEHSELVGIVGPSGSGKSTLLNVIGTLDRPSSGTVRIYGYNIARLRDRQLSALRARTVGFVFQQFHLAAGVAALDNVADGLPTAESGGAAVQPSRDVVEYYAVDRNGVLHGRRRDRGEWSSWRNVPTPQSGHARVVRISAASLKPGHRELYAVLDDGRMMHAWKWDDSPTWSEWYAAGIAGGTDVAACSPKDDLLEHFMLDRDGNVWHRWYWDAWHEWENWGHPGSSARAVTAFRRAVNHQEIFVAGIFAMS
jgi:ABC-type sugar transport system ATPase subunit